MSSGGYLQWDSRFLRDAPFLNGHEWTVRGLEPGFKYKELEDSESFLIQTASGETVIQNPYYNLFSSNLPPRMAFQIPLVQDDEDTIFKILRTKRDNIAVPFVPGLWDEEVYGYATIAGAGYLARPVAWGIGDINSTTHPALFYLDDVLDPDAAHITGTDIITFDKAGKIAVRYMPAYRVMVREIDSSVDESNKAVTSINLEEVRRYGS